MGFIAESSTHILHIKTKDKKCTRKTMVVVLERTLAAAAAAAARAAVKVK